MNTFLSICMAIAVASVGWCFIQIVNLWNTDCDKYGWHEAVSISPFSLETGCRKYTPEGEVVRSIEELEAEIQGQ